MRQDAKECGALIPYRLWVLLAYTRIPGNALSFWLRKTLRWSRGAPALPHESKEGLFAYLAAPQGAEARESGLRARYDLEPLRAHSTAALYRKNLYLIDILERAAQGLDLPPAGAGKLSAMDVGSQDWHYAFGLERWLARGNAAGIREVSLRGVELDGHGIYPDLRSRRDYALAYAAQTGNANVTYEVVDFLRARGGGLDILTWFYPFVTRHHLLLWGLPVHHFAPQRQIGRAAALLRPGGWMLAFTHTLKEHRAFVELARAQGGFELAREGQALSELVDFHEDVEDRRFSVWRRL
jgi:hypothetical protein